MPHCTFFGNEFRWIEHKEIFSYNGFELSLTSNPFHNLSHELRKLYVKIAVQIDRETLYIFLDRNFHIFNTICMVDPISHRCHLLPCIFIVYLLAAFFNCFFIFVKKSLLDSFFNNSFFCFFISFLP